MFCPLFSQSHLSSISTLQFWNLIRYKYFSIQSWYFPNRSGYFLIWSGYFLIGSCYFLIRSGYFSIWSGYFAHLSGLVLLSNSDHLQSNPKKFLFYLVPLRNTISTDDNRSWQSGHQRAPVRATSIALSQKKRKRKNFVFYFDLTFF